MRTELQSAIGETPQCGRPLQGPVLLLRAELAARQSAKPILTAQSTIESQRQVEQGTLQLQLGLMPFRSAFGIDPQCAEVRLACADSLGVQRQPTTFPIG